MQGMSECLQMLVQEFQPVDGVLHASRCLPIGGLSTKTYIDICMKFLFVESFSNENDIREPFTNLFTVNCLGDCLYRLNLYKFGLCLQLKRT